SGGRVAKIEKKDAVLQQGVVFVVGHPAKQLDRIVRYDRLPLESLVHQQLLGKTRRLQIEERLKIPQELAAADNPARRAREEAFQGEMPIGRFRRIQDAGNGNFAA